MDMLNEIDFLDDDDIEVLDLIEYGIPRQIYERNNYFHMLDEAGFYKRFRLSRPCVLNTVLPLIEHRLEYPYDR